MSVLNNSNTAEPLSTNTTNSTNKWLGTIILSLFGGIILLFGLVALLGGFRTWQESATMQNSGIVTTAKIIDQVQDQEIWEGPVGGGGRISHYLITCQFEVPTSQGIQQITQEIQVSRPAYEQLNRGDEIEIRYLPSDPEATVLESEFEPINPLWLVIETILFVVVAVLIVRLIAHLFTR